LSRLLGDEENQGEVGPPLTRASAETFAAAVAEKLAGHPDVALKTVDCLTEQTQLLNVLKEFLNKVRGLRLTHQRNQIRAEDTPTLWIAHSDRLPDFHRPRRNCGCRDHGSRARYSPRRPR
jgi:hypothetical protein